MSSFQGVGIEEFHCIQRCPHFRWLESHYIQRCLLISGGWNREVLLYTEVSSFQGVGIEEFHCIQRCPHSWGWSPTIYRGVLSFQEVGIERFYCIQSVLISRNRNREVLLYTECPHWGGGGLEWRSSLYQKAICLCNMAFDSTLHVHSLLLL